MIRSMITNVEYLLVKWYATLHLQQNRILKLYNENGITRSIANNELRKIYLLMKFYRMIDKYIIILKAKVQSISLEID
ncbi:MAG: hypothetical protein JXR64_06025 [Spirochaetales bacterium]|nr:hypothetical protein [Spirochaetales bacterium]